MHPLQASVSHKMGEMEYRAHIRLGGFCELLHTELLEGDQADKWPPDQHTWARDSGQEDQTSSFAQWQRPSQ